MSVNRGKQFEDVIKQAFLAVPNTSVDRLPDPVQGYLGYRNICDFIVYHKPHLMYIECKSVHGNTLPFSNITDNQWQGMLEKSKIEGVEAGVICWWIDHDTTRFLNIKALEAMKKAGRKSVRYDMDEYVDILSEEEMNYSLPRIPGKKLRVFFEYNMDEWFDYHWWDYE